MKKFIIIGSFKKKWEKRIRIYDDSVQCVCDVEIEIITRKNRTNQEFESERKTHTDDDDDDELSRIFFSLNSTKYTDIQKYRNRKTKTQCVQDSHIDIETYIINQSSAMVDSIGVVGRCNIDD